MEEYEKNWFSLSLLRAENATHPRVCNVNKCGEFFPVPIRIIPVVMKIVQMRKTLLDVSGRDSFVEAISRPEKTSVFVERKQGRDPLVVTPF